jgi:lipopolysaccharide export system permease protein
LMLCVNPLIAAKKGETMAKGLAQDNILDTLQPGRFHVTKNGQRVVYVERITRNRTRADNLFIAEEKRSSEDAGDHPWTVVSAAYGYQMKDPETQQSFIVSADGYRYDGMPGHNDYKIIQFKKYALRLPTAAPTTKHQADEAIPTKTLWNNYDNPEYASELQWRLAMPFSVLMLSFLAIPLSRIQPRQGRYSHLFPAMLIYIVYVNLLFMARNWVEQETVPIFIGMWWVHGLLFCVALTLLLMQQNYMRRPWQWFISLRKSS